MFHCHIKKLLRILLLTQRCDRSQQDPFGKDDRIDEKKKTERKIFNAYSKTERKVAWCVNQVEEMQDSV